MSVCVILWSCRSVSCRTVTICRITTPGRFCSCVPIEQTCRIVLFFFFSSRRRHTRFDCDWSSECSSDLSSAMDRTGDADPGLETCFGVLGPEVQLRGDDAGQDLDDLLLPLRAGEGAGYQGIDRRPQ